jgi:glycosyltransferase involved in cell wall biosynthesis
MLIPLFFLLKQDMPYADIYHSASNGYAGILGAMAKSMYKRPFLLTEHGIYSREREEEIIKSRWAKGYFKDMWISFFYNICKGVYDYSDQVLTLFEKNKDIEVDLGCDKNKIRIIPNGILLDNFTDLPQKDDQDVINIGSVTRIAQIKDIKTMIQSFNIVKKEVPNARFFIMGPTDEDEEYYKECKELAQRLGIEDLNFTGKIDIKDYLGKMDICVLTSISEGQPFVILEAFAAKKPFVSTDVGGCSELIYGNDDGFGKGGFIVPVMNIEKIAQAIVKLCENPGLREEFGLNGYKRTVQLYTFNKCLEDYKKIYEEFGG